MAFAEHRAMSRSDSGLEFVAACNDGSMAKASRQHISHPLGLGRMGRTRPSTFAAATIAPRHPPGICRSGNAATGRPRRDRDRANGARRTSGNRSSELSTLAFATSARTGVVHDAYVRRNPDFIESSVVLPAGQSNAGKIRAKAIPMA